MDNRIIFAGISSLALCASIAFWRFALALEHEARRHGRTVEERQSAILGLLVKGNER